MKKMELLLPTNCIEMDYNEIQYVEGGSVALNNSVAYLSKAISTAKATQLWASGQVKDMSILGISMEIYAHARLYYNASAISGALGLLGISISTINDIISQARVINIDDGGDTLKRRVAFAAIWSLSPM